MHATFHLAADYDLEVRTPRPGEPEGVIVTSITGTGYTADASGHSEITRHVERELVLSKTVARAIASAMMGAAAEL